MSFIHVTDENILSILENTRTNNIFKIVQVKIRYIFHLLINRIKYFFLCGNIWCYNIRLLHEARNVLQAK